MIEKVKEYIQDNDLNNKNRHIRFTWQRYYLFMFLKQNTKLSLCGIGRMFNRDHATIINGLEQYENLKGYEDFQSIVDEVSFLFPMDGVFVETFDAKSEVISMLNLEKKAFEKLNK